MENKPDAKGVSNREKCFRLRIEGKTYREIGEALGMSRTGAFKHVHYELKRIQKETKELAEHYRDIELARLDALFDIIFKKAQNNPAMLAQAHRNIELRCKLLGINAPAELTIRGDDPESILLRMSGKDEAATD